MSSNALLDDLDLEDLAPVPRSGTGVLNGPGEVIPRHDQLALSRHWLPKRAANFAEPTYLWIPEHAVTSAGSAVCDFAELIGRPLDDEQRLALHMLYTEGSDGLLATLEAAIIAPRRNLKTWVLEIAALYDLLVSREPVVIWTAHLFSTTQLTIAWVFELFENVDWLRQQTKRINKQNGEEAVHLITGEKLEFKARSNSGGRGLKGDRIYLDEAFALKGSQIASLIPSMATRRNPQVRYGSSAGLRGSEFLRGVRDRGRPGGDPSLSYLEYAAPRMDCASSHCDHALRTPGCVLERRDLLQRANFGIGRRITWRYIASERSLFAKYPVEFAAERLGWWDDPPPTDAEDVEPPALDADAWKARTAAVPDPPLVEGNPFGLTDVAIAIDVNPLGTHARIGLAGWRPDGRKHVELVKVGEGITWVVDDVVGIVGRRDPLAIALDPATRAGQLIKPLEAAGLDITQMTSRDVAAAAGQLDTDIREDGLTHLDDDDLTDAAIDARWRTLAGAKAFARGPAGADISGLVVIAHAAWALMSKKRKPIAPSPITDTSPTRDGDGGLLDHLGDLGTGMSSEPFNALERDW